MDETLKIVQQVLNFLFANKEIIGAIAAVILAAWMKVKAGKEEEAKRELIKIIEDAGKEVLNNVIYTRLGPPGDKKNIPASRVVAETKNAMKANVVRLQNKTIDREVAKLFPKE